MDRKLKKNYPHESYYATNSYVSKYTSKQTLCCVLNAWCSQESPLKRECSAELSFQHHAQRDRQTVLKNSL